MARKKELVRNALDLVVSSEQHAAEIARGLFAHQVEGVAFLLERRRAILADDMGLGKTRQAIVALREPHPMARTWSCVRHR